MTMVVLLLLLLGAYHHHQAVSATRAAADLSMLSPNQARVWLEAVSQVNDVSRRARIEILQLGWGIELPLRYGENVAIQHRHLFKQDIHKRVDWYVFESELNPRVPSNIYDFCHGTLNVPLVRQTLAGTYVYTSNTTAYGLTVIVVDMINTFKWFNGTRPFLFEPTPLLKNGTRLTLAFETVIYFNANTDLFQYDRNVNQLVKEANISIGNVNKNSPFISMTNLRCEQHQQIIYNQMRVAIFACTTDVTFTCPLEQIGSICWLEDKRISNIRLSIGSFNAYSDRAVTVRISV